MAIGSLRRENCNFNSGKYFWDTNHHQIYIYVTYPTRAENGHPTRAPAATPRMANGGESWNHPVIATSVVYMQKEEGKNAEEEEEWDGENK